MGTLKDWLDDLDKFEGGLPDFNTKLAMTLANTAINDVHGRIVETGKDADGKDLYHARSGKTYSDAELPISVFYNADIPLKPKKGDPQFLSYHDYKKRIGRDKGFRNMNLTGRMWGNTGLTENRGTKTSFYALVKGRNDETQDKLDRNSEMSQVDLLEQSEAEKERLAKVFDIELQVYVDDVFDR